MIKHALDPNVLLLCGLIVTESHASSLIHWWVKGCKFMNVTLVMVHSITGAPCLSFDVIPDKLGEKRDTFPLSMYPVSGTQADRVHLNNVVVFKMSNLQRNKRAKKPGEEETEESGEESDESDEEDEDSKPVLESAMIKHNGGVNRIRVTVNHCLYILRDFHFKQKSVVKSYCSIVD